MAKTSSIEEVSTGFVAAEHGFRFVNNFSIDKSQLGPGSGKVHFGLCGGMCLAALRNFSKKKSAPAVRTIPKAGSALFKKLLADQIETLLPTIWARFFRWQVRPDKPFLHSRYSVGFSTQQQWQRKLRSRLRRGQPTILGLVRSKGKEDPSRNHQVLATGFRYDSAKRHLSLSIYDPNHPRKDVKLTMNFRDPSKGIRIRQSTGEKLRGFFVIGEN
jgi:hypothetical protein